jgi:hypothetical protein
MINEITVEGMVVRTWTGIGDTFYRLGMLPRSRSASPAAR